MGEWKEEEEEKGVLNSPGATIIIPGNVSTHNLKQFGKIGEEQQAPPSSFSSKKPAIFGSILLRGAVKENSSKGSKNKNLACYLNLDLRCVAIGGRRVHVVKLCS